MTKHEILRMLGNHLGSLSAKQIFKPTPRGPDSVGSGRPKNLHFNKLSQWVCCEQLLEGPHIEESCHRLNWAGGQLDLNALSYAGIWAEQLMCSSTVRAEGFK